MTVPTSLPSVLIVGLGLIGGSIGLALRAEGVAVRGVSRSERTARWATELGAVDGASLDLESEVSAAGLVILAAPVRTSIRLLQEVGALAAPGTVVTDVCSSKVEVVLAMEALPDRVAAVGGHPMAGKETAGIEAAESGLFRGTTWVLTQTRRTDERSRALCERLVELCGARPYWVGAPEHDRAVAAISHLPLLVAAALVLAAEEEGSELVWELASSGFRDATRLAAGDVRMGADLLLTNRDAVTEAQERFAGRAEELTRAVQTGDASRLAALLERAAARRRAMYGGER